MKTELEIFRQKTDEFQITEGFNPMTDEEFDDLDEDGLVSKVIIPCMQEFSNQFKPKWISVEERLPEEDGIRVLGYSAFQDEAYMCYSNTNGSERRVSGPGSVKITHWMPLPTKP